MKLKFIIANFYIFTLCIFVMLLNIPAATATQWTLQSSVAQAMSASPELKQSNAKIGSRNADLTLSTMWPDPSIELKIDNQMGRDDGSDNYSLSEITISQDIPLSRIKHQKRVAEAQLSAAMHLKSNDTLILQNRVSKIFYKLQFSLATYELSKKRVKLADRLNTSSAKNNNDTMIRYLTPLEKMRLGIISEKAHQEAAAAEGKLQETLTEFYKLLGINNNSNVTVPELLPVITIPKLNTLIELQIKHPLLSNQQQNLQAATSEVNLARSSAMKDPSISLNRLRENFSSGTEDVYGIMFNIEIPIHNRKNSKVSKANYNASQQRIELARLKRDLQINLNQSYTHLNHIINQASEYKKKVLKPATKILTLTDKGFITGELNILSLIDANNTYFESYTQYLDLIYQSWIELTEMNLYAGQFINLNTGLSDTNNTGVK